MPYFEKLQVDRLNLEFAYRDTGERSDLAHMPKHLGVGIGVLDVRLDQIQTAEEIAALARECMKHIDPKRVALNPDCGFAPDNGEPPSIDEAFQKLRNLSEAAKKLRSE
jgi:5-methyltetrahydropteroyltriglutamate--homocysteine methyltransferase